MTRSKKNEWIILMLISLLVIVYFFTGQFFRQQTLKNPIYRSCELTRIDIIGKSGSDWLIFKYYISGKEKQGRVYILDDNYDFYKNRIGKKYIIAMNKNQIVNKLFLTYRLYINYPIPDSVFIPPNGWTEIPSWIKKQ